MRMPVAGGPGNAFAFDQPEEHHERKDVLAAQEFIKQTCVHDNISALRAIAPVNLCTITVCYADHGSQ